MSGKRPLPPTFVAVVATLLCAATAVSAQSTTSGPTSTTTNGTTFFHPETPDERQPERPASGHDAATIAGIVIGSTLVLLVLLFLLRRTRSNLRRARAMEMMGDYEASDTEGLVSGSRFTHRPSRGAWVTRRRLAAQQKI
jgi:hypothetical protein